MPSYNVARNGKDTNNGSVYTPLLTLGAALAKAEAATDPVNVYLHEEVVNLGVTPVTVPDNTTIIGAGKHTTVNGAFVMKDNSGLRNLKLRGLGTQCIIGVQVLDCRGVELNNLDIADYRDTAILIDNVFHCNVSNIVIRNSSYNENKTAVPGKIHTVALYIGRLTNCFFDNIDIDTQAGGRGGQAIFTSLRSESMQANKLIPLRDTVFNRLKLVTDQWHTWHTGQTPMLSLELHDNEYINVAILNGNFVNPVSINSFRYVGPGNNILVARNYFSGSKYGTYCFETGADQLEFKENILHNAGYSTIANWGGVHDNTSYHHNLFVNCKGTACLRLSDAQPGMKFHHNTIYNTTPEKHFSLNATGGTYDISRNLFVTSGDVNVNDLPSGATFANNLLYGFSSPNSGSVVANPQFANTADVSFAGFKPTNSAANGYGAVSTSGGFN